MDFKCKPWKTIGTEPNADELGFVKTGILFIKTPHSECGVPRTKWKKICSCMKSMEVSYLEYMHNYKPGTLCKSEVQSLRRLRQEDREFVISLAYIVKSYVINIFFLIRSQQGKFIILGKKCQHTGRETFKGSGMNSG